jgi:small subunit ribosomal protein S35
MASLPRRLLLQSRQCPSRIRCRAPQKHTARSIATTPRRLANDDSKLPPSSTAAPAPPAANEAPSKSSAGAPKYHEPSTMTEDEIAAAQLAQLVSDLKNLDPAAIAEGMRKGQRGMPYATQRNLEKEEDFMIEEDDRRKVAAGFWAEGEESMGPDEDYYGDDLTSHGHGELKQHRMLREYNRLVAWEMPLLGRTSSTPPLPSPPIKFKMLILEM